MFSTVKRMGFAANLAATLFFAFRAPTDSIRIWYPSIWSYLGESFLVFLICLSCVFFVLQRLPKKRRPIEIQDSYSFPKLVAYGMVTLLVDIAISAYLWFVAPRSGDLPTLSYSRHDFSGYLTSRELVFVCVFLAISISQYLIRRFGTRSSERTGVIVT